MPARKNPRRRAKEYQDMQLIRAVEQAERIKANRDAAIARRRASATKTVVVSVPQTLRSDGENKYVDGYLDATTIHELATNDDGWDDCELNPRQQTAIYGCLPVPRQGDGFADRDGRKIIIKKIVIRGQIDYSSTAALTAAVNSGAIVRIVIVKDKQTNGIACDAENVLGPGEGSDGQATLLADAGVMALSKPSGWGRYQIMKDKMYTPPGNQVAFYDGTDGNVNGTSIPFKFTLKLNTEVNFSGTTGAIGSIVDNSFHLFAACSNTGVTTPKLSYIARTTFIG